MEIPEQALYTTDQVRALDQRAIEATGIESYALMCRAGEAAFHRLRFFWPGGSGRLLVLTGPGNNGGDGYVIARLAKQAELPLALISATDPQRLKGDAARARDDWLAAGGQIQSLQDGFPPDTGMIVDALLGTGLSRAPEGVIAELIDRANAHPAPVFAVDCPSGLEGDSGMAPGTVIRASHTSTFIGHKRGLFTGHARAVTGRVHFERLSVPDGVYQGMTPDAFLIARREVAEGLPKRQPTAHKGHHGHVLVLGGDHGMGGAAILAAEAAQRGGAGRVSLFTRPEHLGPALARAPGLLVADANNRSALRAALVAADVIVVGPGLGQARWGRRLWRAALESGKPLILDADALNLLAKNQPSLTTSAVRDWVLTPHPGEAGRLLGRQVAQLEGDRFAALDALVDQYHATVVLKGAGTLVASPGQPRRLCDAGNPGMAVAGMGDVLAGLLAALRAQGMPAIEAATAAVWLHASAGDLAAREFGQRGLQPQELLAPIRRLANPHEGRR